MAGKGRKVTSARVAKVASRVLKSKSQDKASRITAASALSQREKSRRKKK
ncbi:MAG: hypothetical protein AAB675_02750 [Patescibacteria group bacterium]